MKKMPIVSAQLIHRLISWSVLVVLMIGEFTDKNIGQLNTYTSCCCKNMMSDGDNSPLGVFLAHNCATACGTIIVSRQAVSTAVPLAFFLNPLPVMIE